MSRKNTGLAVAIGAAIAVGAVVAFASGKKAAAAPDDDDDDDDDDDAPPALPDAAPVSPVVPSGVTPLGTPPFVPPGLITVSNPSPTTPGVGPAIPEPPVAPTPVQPTPPVVQLPDDDDEQQVPTVVPLPGITIPGTVPLPGGAVVTVPPIPGITAPAPAVPAPPAPPVVAVEQPSAVPSDTAALVALMLADEATPGWKRKYPELGAWQAARGRTVDQMFGPGDAVAMAQEIGTLPIIRYWPRGSLPQTALQPYRSQLAAIAATAPEPRRAQLLMTSAREQGQGFAGPASTAPIATRLNLTAVA
jgi:hypothetical protein